MGDIERGLHAVCSSWQGTMGLCDCDFGRRSRVVRVGDRGGALSSRQALIARCRAGVGRRIQLRVVEGGRWVVGEGCGRGSGGC